MYVLTTTRNYPDGSEQDVSCEYETFGALLGDMVEEQMKLGQEYTSLVFVVLKRAE